MDPKSDCPCDLPNTRLYNAVLIALMILIIVYVWNWAPGPWDYLERMNSSDLGSRLKSAGWVLYSRMGCPWCTKQLGEFSDSEKRNLHVIECGGDSHECAGITGFPTWLNRKTGQKSSGYKNRQALESLL